MTSNARRLPLLGSIALIFLLGSSAFAQLQTGSIHGTVLFQDGDPLPGVTVELGRFGAADVRVTDAGGNFHYPGLPPGRYELSATLDGFSAVIRKDVAVRVGKNTALELVLVPAIDETIEVVAEAPLLDERKITSGATVTQDELERIPSARDPWVVLQTVPGVLTDDVNVGGNRGGRQQIFTGSGSSYWNNTYAIDGVVITDAFGNSSSRYFDFDSLREVLVSTGGSDVSRPSGGVVLNLVTKRGTNQWRGSSRYAHSDDDWQAGLELDASKLGPNQEAFTQGDRIASIDDYGIEGGGPLVRDRLWGWAHYAKNEFDKRTIYDGRDLTELEFYGLKIDADPSRSHHASILLDRSVKIALGRGAGPDLAQPATWDQHGGADIYKLEDTLILGSDFFLNGVLSYVDSGFDFIPEGGLDGPNGVIDENFVGQENNYYYQTTRPQKQARLEASWFHSTGTVSHEIEAGGGYRVQDTDELYGWPGDVIRLDFYKAFGFSYNVAAVTRPAPFAYKTEYSSAFLQDTILFNRLTANIGLRLDRQQSSLGSASAPGAPGFETLPDGTPLMPAISFEGGKQDFTWSDVTPRLGITVAVDRNRDTLLRASYARFADQMDQYWAQVEWPLGWAYAYFYYDDSDGDGRVSPDEIIGFEDGPIDTNGYDPNGRIPAWQVDPALQAPISEELIVALEHSFLPELVAGLDVTWRRQSKFFEEETLVEEDGVVRPHRRTDYALLREEKVTLPDGMQRTVPIYTLQDGIRDTGRKYIHNTDRGSDYLGISLHADKRLSNHWMMRGHVTWSDWTWSIPDNTVENPTPGSGFDLGWDRDGNTVLMSIITPGWSYRLGGLFEVATNRPWRFNLSGNVWGRQGYAIPYYIRDLDLNAWIQATEDVADYRLPAVHLVDLRVDRDFAFRNVTATLGVECFNVLNASTVLARNARLGTGTTNHVQRIVNPRVFRLFARFSFG